MSRFRPLPRSGGPRPAGALPLAGGPLWFAEAAEHRRGAAAAAGAGGGGAGGGAGAADGGAGAGLRAGARSAADHGRAERHPRQLLGRRAAPGARRCGGGGPGDGRGRGRHPRRRRRVDAAGRRSGGRRGGDRAGGAGDRRARAEGFARPISIDTRSGAVARAAFDAGADLLNDVSALDPRPGEPRGRRGLRPAGLPDARPGRPEDDAGRAGLRRRAARRRRLAGGAGRGGRGGGDRARAHPRRPRHRLRQDRRAQPRARPRARDPARDWAARSCSAPRASASSARSATLPTPATGCRGRSRSRSRLCGRARR